jgi:hypothetical protein
MANGIYNNGARPRQQRSRMFKVWVSGDNCERLMAAASKRGTPPDRLLEALVHHVLEGTSWMRSLMTDRRRRRWRAVPPRATRRSNGLTDH